MRVVALKRGLFDGAVYEAGDEFDVPDSVMTAKKDANGTVVPPGWFKAVEKPVAEKSVEKKKGA